MLKTLPALIVGFALSGGAQAALIDRGDGMIYDDVLHITWLQDASLGANNRNWHEAVAWADGLVFGGFDDWRLPLMDVNLDDEIVYCPTSTEMACRDNQLAYMFYHNLGGMILDSLTGDQGPFHSITGYYWSGTEFASNPNLAWYFTFIGGMHGIEGKDFEGLAAWAVRPGDVVIPLPASVLLLGSSLLGLAGLARRQR